MLKITALYVMFLNFYLERFFLFEYDDFSIQYFTVSCSVSGADLKYVKQVARRSENYLTQNIFRAAF